MSLGRDREPVGESAAHHSLRLGVQLLFEIHYEPGLATLSVARRMLLPPKHWQT